MSSEQEHEKLRHEKYMKERTHKKRTLFQVEKEMQRAAKERSAMKEHEQEYWGKK